MKLKVLFIVALAICLSSSLALADTLQGVTTFSSFTLDEDGTPYWDNKSQDGSQQNVGYYLTNIGGFAGSGLNPALTNPQYLTLTTGVAANRDFYFQSTYGSAITLLLEVSAWEDNNIFGYYDITSSNTLNPIFSGTISPGGIGSTYLLTLASGANYGFYFQNPNGDTYRTQASLDSSLVTTLSHFAVFKGDNYANTLFIGMEDQNQLANGVGDGEEGLYGDFNDMVVGVKAVPLPGAILLLGAGLARLAAYARRKED